MSLIVKIMSPENAPDDDSRKGCILAADVRHVAFDRDGRGAPWIYLWRAGDNLQEPAPERIGFSGNVYVMNEGGRTVSTFGAMVPYWHRTGADSDPEAPPGNPASQLAA